ncbi:MAG: hypothetical protein IPM33_03075 [Phycisphaerales bacterium]|nr:hypothetical protein [Phycisphaerales bacterium]
MAHKGTRRSKLIAGLFGGTILAIGGSLAIATIIELTFEDLHLRGTQVNEIPHWNIQTSQNCMLCHGEFDEDKDPYATWHGSLMGQAGRDPLFYAQMTLANQDTVNAGYFCMRCHVPMTFVTGHAYQPDGTTIDDRDKDGVNCHFCHSMVDPVYRPGVSPPGDESLLAGLQSGAPQHYGNSMFVLDPLGVRRSARGTPDAPHAVIQSPFHSTGSMCGTCHEVGNPAVSRQVDGSYRYNTLDQAPPTEDPEQLFPLERTYTEWKLSSFANGGVSMGGRFGGLNADVVSTCQDCHMPKVESQLCFFGPTHNDARAHDFAGASAQVLDIIAVYTANDPDVNQDYLARGRAKAVAMLQRAADLELTQSGPLMNVRVINQSGHKIPTGHIEGRLIFINVQFFDAGNNLIAEHGHYNPITADLDAASTRVYEMRVGLTPFAASITGLPAGETGHMALADMISFDNRIPPRGFNNAAFEASGAPAVGHPYADGQHWDDAPFPIPQGAASARVSINYQQTPKWYIEHLHHDNHTNNWGQILYDAWVSTGKGAPIEMAVATIDLTPPCIADFNGSGGTPDDADVFAFFEAWNNGEITADVNGSGGTPDDADVFYFFERWNAGC